MTKVQNIIEHLKREAANLGLTFELDHNGRSYFIDMKADDAKLFVIIGPRGAMKFISYIDPLYTVSTYKGKNATYFKVGYFFGAVARQRKIIAERQAA